MPTQKHNKATKNQLFEIMISANERIGQLTAKQKATLEKGWDIEHAYYSSVLEGSKLDRKEFEVLGEKVA